MKATRSALLLVSITCVLFLLGGGLAVKVGAGENYDKMALFAEVLDLVVENYVDPVDSEVLLQGAYEGMLGGLDAHGAFLSPAEVREWKARGEARANPGLSLLKTGHALEVVAVTEGSPAAEAGILPGDQIRRIDDRPIRDLSLDQSLRLLHGPAGGRVRLEILHPADGFRREELEVARVLPLSRPYDLQVDGRGIALLRVRDLPRVGVDLLAAELEDVRSRGVKRLLIDVRGAADSEPRVALRAVGLFVASGKMLQLRDRAGQLVESLEVEESVPAWPGEIAVLVNAATAGSAEALATVLQKERGGKVFGESTYGLGAEAKLYEFEDGSGLVLSAALWETPSGGRWNGEGVQPDEVIHGRGQDYASRFADQLEQTLEWLAKKDAARPEPEVEKVREAA